MTLNQLQVCLVPRQINSACHRRMARHRDQLLEMRSRLAKLLGGPSTVVADLEYIHDAEFDMVISELKARAPMSSVKLRTCAPDHALMVSVLYLQGEHALLAGPRVRARPAFMQVDRRALRPWPIR